MAEIITSDMIRKLCPERPEDGHKGTFGTALIVAGSRYMTGALTLAAIAALRSGCGMVRVFAPEECLMPVSINCPCALLSSWGATDTESIRRCNSYLPSVKAAGIGPGLDESDSRSLALLEHLILNAKNIVIDAGALNIMAKNRERVIPLLSRRVDDMGLAPAVVTPHLGEFKRLIRHEGDMSFDELIDLSCQFALQNKCVAAVKTHKTIVSDGSGKCYINTAGNNGMAKGGSGDVLTGLVTGLLAQGMEPFDAAVSGVYLHAASGDLAALDIGKRAMIPEDLPGYFDEAFAGCGWE